MKITPLQNRNCAKSFCTLSKSVIICKTSSISLRYIVVFAYHLISSAIWSISHPQRKQISCSFRENFCCFQYFYFKIGQDVSDDYDDGGVSRQLRFFVNAFVIANLNSSNELSLIRFGYLIVSPFCIRIDVIKNWTFIFAWLLVICFNQHQIDFVCSKNQ